MSRKVFFKLIVPNYNNMTYIKKCLDSIVQQTFQDFICVVADDMSTDMSDRLVEFYERRYPGKVKLIRLTEKKYAGGARNAALMYDKYESEYIWFIDSDDWLYDNTVLKKMYDRIVSTNYPDLLECPYFDNGKNQTIKLPASTLENVIKGGAWPLRHCVSSKYAYLRFKENRAKSNDMVWFYKLVDALSQDKNTRVVNINQTCGVYNRKSTTSCQNGAPKFSPECVYAQSMLLEDLHEEDFKSDVVKNHITNIVEKVYIKNSSVRRIDIDEAMHNAFVISIDEKRLEKFNGWFSQNNLIVPTYIEGSHDKNCSGPRNCTLSHCKVIQKAKELRLPYVIVFEDDAYPCIDIRNTLQKYLKIVPDDANMVLLGWGRCVSLLKDKKVMQKFEQPFNEMSWQNTTFWGSHAYMLFSGAYDRYLNFFKSMPNMPADGRVYNYIKEVYIPNKPFFIQYNAPSEKTIHNISGYTYNGQHKDPPAGFPPIDKYIIKNRISYTVKTNDMLKDLDIESKIKPISQAKINDIISAAQKFNYEKVHARIDNPSTMTDKIRYVSTYGVLDAAKTFCADKILLHEYSKQILGEDICIPILKVYDTLNDIKLEELPDQFVLKTNHGCHTNLIVKNKHKFDLNNGKTILERWLNKDFSTLIHETHYNRIVPKAFSEVFMFDGNEDSLTDYKFLCFNGSPMYCQIINDRHNMKKRLNYYDMDFKFVNICRNDFRCNSSMLDKKPECWNKMKELAAKLSKPFDFVRVDMYVINGKIYLGELTFTPGAGTFKYINENDNIALGQLWNLKKLT